jgi:hypothetical protein
MSYALLAVAAPKANNVSLSHHCQTPSTTPVTASTLILDLDMTLQHP